ncbi:DUF927 domain-containing protein [Bacillus sp. V2I10]|uniref:DUF927 domain-containing protein n=1 Tax=Bacillus sp. V2I10 TaxID=3042276 RepID=UPI002788B720|nr:DUF927 domain-containing protein [Bacillus sp. V2I10]MDQ0856584.1 putative DNA primase/helicase [Bacillus sp. V2I10]
MLHNSYVREVEMIFPNTKIIKCQGYSNGNNHYSTAKKPLGSYINRESLTETEIKYHLARGGWIGALIPNGFIVIDVDDVEHGSYLIKLLKGERVQHHLIRTPRGYQFVFKASSTSNKQVKMISRFFTSIGILIDTRVGTTNSFIVFPSQNTEKRFIVEVAEDLDELPVYLRPVWNAQKTKDYHFAIPMVNGSRNQSLYDLGRRLKSIDVPLDQVKKSMLLIYKYFCIDKDRSYTWEDVMASIDSIAKLEQTSRKKEEPIEINNISQAFESRLPEPYLKKEGSLYKKEMKKIDGKLQEVSIFVSRNVPYITKYLENLERSEIYYEICWNNMGREFKETVAASTIASKREILSLADKGLSCNDSNSKHLIEYFDLFIAKNDIPTVQIVNRLGKIKEKFIHPVISNEIQVLPNDGGELQLYESFKVKGTVDSWIKNVFNLVKNHPKAVLPILSSFASVILHEFDMKPIVIDVSGASSSGKSGILRMCASVWGDPERYLGTFNTTLVAVERRSTFLNSFPQILDDSNGASESKMIQPMIYQYVNNTGKQRGSLNGSQYTDSWNSLMITSGENEIVTYANAQGVPARVILISNFSFEGEDHDYLGKVYDSFRENFGAIGIEFLNRWQENREHYMKYFKAYEKQFLEISCDNNILKRLSRHYSFIVFTGRVLNEMFKNKSIGINLRDLEELFVEMSKTNKAIDLPIVELQNALEDIDANRNKLYADYEPQGTINAFFHNGDFYFAPAYLKQRLGLNEKQIRYLWMKRGLTDTFINRDNEVDYKVIKKNKRSFRGVLVNREIIEQLGFNFS